MGKTLTSAELIQILERVKDECGSEIDDTAGAGDTTKVWSADKTNSELSNLNSAISDSFEELGFTTIKFNKIDGSGHSSNNDKINVNIKSGDEFYVTVSQIGSNSEFAYQLWGWLNGTATRILNFTSITSSERRKITAAANYDQLSVYIGNDLYSGSAEVTLRYETSQSKIKEIEGIEENISELGEISKKHDTDIYGLSFPFVDVGKGAYYNSTGGKANNSNYSYGFANVSGASEVVVDTTELSGKCIINVCDQNKGFIRNAANWANPNKYIIQIGTGEVYICVSALTTEFKQIAIRNTDSVEESIVYRLNTSENEIIMLNRKTKDILIPILRNGSAGNAANANSISTQYIIPIDHSKDTIVVEYLGDTSLADEYAWSYCAFRGATDGMTSSAAFADTSITKYNYNQNATERIPTPRYELPITNIANYDHIMFYLWRYKNNVVVPLRIANDQYNLKITYEEKDGIQSQRDIDFADTKHDLINAKHAKGNTGTRLTILHFSDLHADTAALARIMKDAKEFEYDDAICTGDIVSNSAGQIASWWDESVLTCIGNHDSASYSSGSGYDWTALSMADRDAYYIAPFESNWGITHTSGKSYYYKDYLEAKVRMIVMDSMLYTDNGQEAADQTTWLNNLLTSAITNNLHVVIAIHAPHGGAEAKECSFSRYGQTTMPTYQDCNTPQLIIDAVAEKITAGLKFIGYLVGHTHQDNIWDAENDGTQLMYCITCAHVNNSAQWANSDQHRDAESDAYNIVVIDTANTLVKIIRGGGANIDDHMRTRKAICIDYSTGTVVGEVL